MNVHNLHHYTEHHRYCVYREFGLSSIDQKMLMNAYQPMIGAFAVALYQFLFQHVLVEKIGYSTIEYHRNLFLTLGLDPNEKGRKYVMEHLSKLEAVGLLHTFRLYLTDQDEYMYEYELQPPLSPSEFFRTQHLTLLLRDKIGKFAVLTLHAGFTATAGGQCPYDVANKENISAPFYDIFNLNTHVIDYELEQALAESGPTATPKFEPSGVENYRKLNYSDLISRFPQESNNRRHVEQLRFDQEQLGTVNYVVHKFNLTVSDVCRLLDEDDVFSSNGQLHLEVLQQKASLQFRQTKKRRHLSEVKATKLVRLRNQTEKQAPCVVPPEEHGVQMEYYVDVPVQFASKCDVHQYNMMLRNERYYDLLQTFFPGQVPQHLIDIFEKIDLSYKLPEPAINVLIHYVMSVWVSSNDQRINQGFVEMIASNMLLKQVNTYEKAVKYIRDQTKVKHKPGLLATGSPTRKSSSTYGKQTKTKPSIPIAQNSSSSDGITEAEFNEMMRFAEQMQANKNTGAAKPKQTARTVERR